MIDILNEEEIQEWGNDTFPESEPFSLIAHMQEELHELREAVTAVENDMDNYNLWNTFKLHGVLSEIGDLGIMLIHLAGMYETTLEECVREKFETARHRSYKYDPALGYARHVDE